MALYIGAIGSFATASCMLLWMIYCANRHRLTSPRSNQKLQSLRRVPPSSSSSSSVAFMDETHESAMGKGLTSAVVQVKYIHVSSKSEEGERYASFTAQLSWGDKTPHTTVVAKRRFSDFCKLTTEIKAAHPALPVPNLPPKTLVRRFDEGFLEKRRQGLELFLRRVTADPILSELKCVQQFCGVAKHV
ncbi:Aste57867_8713 [Aphanomyces stellatus]|uniref:Aste57867_8713 protein n=1 Tax=Aphanomyces stellatus TaxID=120398 RepID=A0A485KL70_9STRA|nr:hypothetical protein As57867_008679 [Aphanomyces stellatus]VFT85599.1 Aste57867_8713 [Aphanomyces stellatus]